jgi:hypothetical protein
MFVTAVTLFLVTLPVQLLFLTFVYAVGWTRLPFVFIAIFVLFFCCTVSLEALLLVVRIRVEMFTIIYSGSDLARYGPPIDILPLAAGSRPGHLRDANTKFAHRSHGTAYARCMLRACASPRCRCEEQAHPVTFISTCFIGDRASLELDAKMIVAFVMY